MRSVCSPVASASTDPSIRVELPGDRLQDLRLLQALSESDYPIHVAPQHLWKLQQLKETFEINVLGATGDEFLLSDFEIVHEIPLTRIGLIERALIFPDSLFAHLKPLWSSSRDIDFSFIGLITTIRLKALNGWLCRQGVAKKIPSLFSLRTRRLLRRHIDRWLLNRPDGATQFIFSTSHGVVMLGASGKGRVLPGKAWDENYFKMLTQSRFVLCPVGDCVWTYRFFESAMCGAIPIVEASCASYQGFRYFTMEDDISTLKWSAEIAEYNFNLCRERLTVPRELLNAEIGRIIGLSDEAARHTNGR